ncbi:hypothetical protein AK812_SmicGene34314 [Symbiodinium microadriaticum]|uniref:Uncharacterized protein n=1 Tax=Symbiodinium microadriaticum TaxID=2951 RepID=A0A1Q9CPD2_SYMMI|nr:hypothetical protein AK812_SmicGene34314 [Symbiodinium microadriaticum]
MEPEYESPPGLGLDLSVLRAMLGEQADLIRTSSEQNLGKLQGAWIKHFEQLRDKVAAQNTFVQQLSERCRYLEDQLQQLMGARHRAEAATATKVIQNSGSGNVRQKAAWQASRVSLVRSKVQGATTIVAPATVTPKETYVVSTQGKDSDEVVVRTLVGDYMETGTNHGRKVFKKGFTV